MLTFVAKKQSHKVLGQAKRQSRAMSVRNPNYQQVHDLYELCSDGRSLQESASKPKELSIRDLNVRLSNGTYKS